MATTSKVDICNMALGRLGNYSSISNIDTPTASNETTFALWYDTTREALLKTVMPNFAVSLRTIPQLSTDVPYPFTYAYQYPSDCLKVLGIGAVEDKENNYTINGTESGKVIYSDVLYSDGLPLRFVRNVEIVGNMDSDFKILLSIALAANVALDITRSASVVQTMEQLLQVKMMDATALNAQENRPIRISRSNYRHAKITGHGLQDIKR